MKKTFANIRTLAALLIASAALAACSNDDGAIIGEQPAQQQAPQVYTLTLQAGKADNAQTRALALDGEKLVAKWVAGEEVTVKRGDDELGTLSVKEGSVSADGKTCTFTGSLTGTIATDDVLTLTYHPVASLAAYASQTGTLESASGYDVATASVTVTAVDNDTQKITAGTATFATQTAMLKITMQDAGGNKINATKLQVKVDFGSAGARSLVSISPTDATYTANGNGILYFALPNATNAKSMLPGIAYQEAFDAATVSFTVTNGDESYTINTGKKYIFEGGKYYATTLTKPGPTIVTWSPVDFNGSTYTQDDVTLTPSNGSAASAKNFYDYGSNTFTTTLGKFTKIEIVCTYGDIDGWTKEEAGKYQPYPYDDPDEWRDLYKLTWTGDAESVTIQKDVYGIQSITFTIQ